MYYCYGKGVQKNVLCREVVPFSEGPLSEVPLCWGCYYLPKHHLIPLKNSIKIYSVHLIRTQEHVKQPSTLLNSDEHSGTFFAVVSSCSYLSHDPGSQSREAWIIVPFR